MKPTTDGERCRRAATQDGSIAFPHAEAWGYEGTRCSRSSAAPMAFGVTAKDEEVRRGNEAVNPCDPEIRGLKNKTDNLVNTYGVGGVGWLLTHRVPRPNGLWTQWAISGKPLEGAITADAVSGVLERCSLDIFITPHATPAECGVAARRRLSAGRHGISITPHTATAECGVAGRHGMSAGRHDISITPHAATAECGAQGSCGKSAGRHGIFTRMGYFGGETALRDKNKHQKQQI